MGRYDRGLGGSAVALSLLVLCWSEARAQVPPDPRGPSADRLRDNLSNLPLPPLAIASDSTRSIPALVAPNNALPAVDAVIRTTGGAAPVNFTIVGGAAANLFQIVAPHSGTITRVLSEAEQAAAALVARQERKPAGTVQRTLRFLGAPNAAAVPAALPVQIRATDALGASVLMTVNALPFAPRVAPVNFERTARETTAARWTVQGLGNATQVRVDSVGGACGYVQNPRISYGGVETVSAGVASFSRTGTFRTSAASCAGLRLTIAVRFADMPDFAAPVVLTVPTFNFRAPQTYAFSNTWALRDFLGFSVAASHTGSCSGESLGTSGTFPIGVFRSSDDITFAIRSGPLGTECDFASLSRRLPDGFTLTRLEFVQSEGPNDSLTPVQMAEPRRYCKIGGSGGTVGGMKFDFTRGKHVLREANLLAPNGPDLSQFVLSGFERPLVTGDGVEVLGGSDTHFAVVMLPLYLKLRCVITPSNSEFYVLRLNRVELVGPPGVAFP